MIWLLEAVGFLFFLAVLFFFYRFLYPKRVPKYASEALLYTVAILQTLFLIYYILQNGTLPLFNRIDLLFTFSYLLTIIAIFVQLSTKLDLAVAILLFISATMFWIYFFGASLNFTYVNEWNHLVKQMMVHILFSIISYCLFSISFVFSIIYIMQAKWLKEKKITKLFSRFTSLEVIEKYSYTFVLLGVPFLFFALIIGLVFLYWHIDSIVILDTKIIGSIVVLLLYSIYLYLRNWSILTTKQLCYWNIGSYLLVLTNYFLFSSLSNFHIWY